MAIQTRLDFIAQQINSLIVEAGTISNDVTDYAVLLNDMKSFKVKSQLTFKTLYRIPGFRKLWDAVENALEEVTEDIDGTVVVLKD